MARRNATHEMPAAIWPALAFSVAFHIMGAILLGLFTATMAPSPVQTISFGTMTMELSDTAIQSSSGGSAEATPRLHAERPREQPAPSRPRPAPDNPLLAPERDLTPRLVAPPPMPQPQLRDTPDFEKRPFAPDATVESVVVDDDSDSAVSAIAGAGAELDGGFGPINQRAAPRATIRPVYPIGARRRGEEGSVTVEFTVLANGHSADFKITKPGSTAEFDRAAENAVNSARFTPALYNGQATKSRIRLTFIFRLRD